MTMSTVRQTVACQIVHVREANAMHTSQVIRALLGSGWRYEFIGNAELPVLTNAPEGKVFCVDCGEWVIQAQFTWSASMCNFCKSNRVARTYWVAKLIKLINQRRVELRGLTMCTAGPVEPAVHAASGSVFPHGGV